MSVDTANNRNHNFFKSNICIILNFTAYVSYTTGYDRQHEHLLFFFYSVSDTILSVRAFVKSRAVCLEELQPLFTEVKNSLMTGSQPRSGLIVQKTENEVRNVTSIISYTRHLLYMVTSAGAVLLY